MSLSTLLLSLSRLSIVTISFGIDSMLGNPCPSVYLNQLLIVSFVILLFLYRKGGFSRDTNIFVAQVAVENCVVLALLQHSFLAPYPAMRWEGPWWSCRYVHLWVLLEMVGSKLPLDTLGCFSFFLSFFLPGNWTLKGSRLGSHLLVMIRCSIAQHWQRKRSLQLSP